MPWLGSDDWMNYLVEWNFFRPLRTLGHIFVRILNVYGPPYMGGVGHGPIKVIVAFILVHSFLIVWLHETVGGAIRTVGPKSSQGVVGLYSPLCALFFNRVRDSICIL